eukprot:m.46914 g.46914  ORF g.46914 m.46914 type:complete len:306 (-) comp17574_c0_seq6:31-948(-)
MHQLWLLFFFSVCAYAQINVTLKSYFGETPTIDGHLYPDEWRDATNFTGTALFINRLGSQPKTAIDLSCEGFIKHDDTSFYLGVKVTDNLLFSIDTPLWTPPENPDANLVNNRTGWPWFGDEMELLIDTGRNLWHNETATAAGNSSSWQMVVNLIKSHEHGCCGAGKGGVLQGEPRSNLDAWNTYTQWIDSGAHKAATSILERKEGQPRGYILEWAVRFDPCFRLPSGKFYNASMPDTTVGFNIALGDLDSFEDGNGVFGHFHHETWLTTSHASTQCPTYVGNQCDPTKLQNYGALTFMKKDSRR